MSALSHIAQFIDFTSVIKTPTELISFIEGCIYLAKTGRS
ncbi:MAG: hypothetical protein OFPII_41370 [Osedax symbiont Rs1]|nr:MAG: hypothetical protein OFPII_41370 [Osedax symbiont Rs1]